MEEQVSGGADPKKFETLFYEHNPRLITDIARMTCRVRVEDVEDIAFDTWLAAWKGFPTFKGQSEFYTWLWSIARHKVIDWWRRQPISVDIEIDIIEIIVSPRLVTKIELDQRIAAACLTAAEANVLAFKLQDLTTNEIAKELNITPTTVRTHIENIRKKVQRVDDSGGTSREIHACQANRQ